MLPNQHLEFLIHERHQTLLDEAKERRRLKQIPKPVPHRGASAQPIAHWLGARLVGWGLWLQGEQRPLLQVEPPQPSLG
ncbi:MAG TPA: hypothetical protein PKE45_26250 [Caldilineaceae bacterium]|nr:hypothetical protein [Caldilineaceae bacterium]